tara:strand:+ start:175 stop:333 length:159 start_codon:yes stop_codon:yes gene_type:complete
MPSELSKKALDAGLITPKQYKNLPPALLEAIAKKKMGASKPVKKKKKKKTKK